MSKAALRGRRGGLGAAVAALLLMASEPAFASEALAEQHGCSNCHLPQKKLVGPAYQAVAERYRGQADVPERLVAKVAQGGVGVWGAVPMPAMSHVPADDARALVAWILAHTAR